MHFGAKITGLMIIALTALPLMLIAKEPEHARKLINSQGCKSCHSLEGHGSNFAATFESMSTLSRSEIRLQLSNPNGTHGNGNIPDFSHLSKVEIETLVDFIASFVPEKERSSQ